MPCWIGKSSYFGKVPLAVYQRNNSNFSRFLLIAGSPEIAPLLLTMMAVPNVPVIGPVEPLLLMMQTGPALPSGQALVSTA